MFEPDSIINGTVYDKRCGTRSAVNGVPIYDYSNGGELDINNWSYDFNEATDSFVQLDECGGHAGKSDDYNYHKKSSCMREMMLNKDQNPILGMRL